MSFMLDELVVGLGGMGLGDGSLDIGDGSVGIGDGVDIG